MLTDPSGAPVPADDPRIPTAEAIEEVRVQADQAAAVLAANGIQVDALVTLEAKVDALVSLMVPPEGPVRSLYEHRLQTKRGETFARMIEAAQAAQRGPALQIASSVPQDLRLEIVPR